MSIFVTQYYHKQKSLQYNYIKYEIIERACKIYALYKIKLLYNLKKNYKKMLENFNTYGSIFRLVYRYIYLYYGLRFKSLNKYF